MFPTLTATENRIHEDYGPVLRRTGNDLVLRRPGAQPPALCARVEGTRVRLLRGPADAGPPREPERLEPRDHAATRRTAADLGGTAPGLPHDFRVLSGQPLPRRATKDRARELGFDPVPRFAHLDDPKNLTKLGVGLTESLTTREDGEEEIVVCFHSITTLLARVDGAGVPVPSPPHEHGPRVRRAGALPRQPAGARGIRRRAGRDAVRRGQGSERGVVREVSGGFAGLRATASVRTGRTGADSSDRMEVHSSERSDRRQDQKHPTPSHPKRSTTAAR